VFLTVEPGQAIAARLLPLLPAGPAAGAEASPAALARQWLDAAAEAAFEAARVQAARAGGIEISGIRDAEVFGGVHHDRRARSRSLCTAAHPLYSKFTHVPFGASLSAINMRPNPRSTWRWLCAWRAAMSCARSIRR
jgi:hypothetical protein